MRISIVALIVATRLFQPVLASGAAYQFSYQTDLQTQSVEPWWVNTSMDKDKDRIQDNIWLAIESKKYDWVDEYGRIGVIVDFDHTPTSSDAKMLSESVDFIHSHTYHLIDSIAGSVLVEDIVALSKLPGVVMVELDGILEVANSDVKDVHGVWGIYEETGYDGAGSVIAIIDTGIDDEHLGLDDLDDDNTTDDPKVIAFFDAINNASVRDGSTEPYDGNGHGSHCAGTTAGTGAPTYEHTGMAPQAQLVGVKVLSDSGSGSFSQVMDGMEWTVDNRHEFNIRIASMSLGGFGAIEWTQDEEESVNRMANEMVRNGIALFIAAGNNAISAQIGTPGSAEDVITVGALDKDTAIAIYSSQGPTEEGRIKPNIAFVGSSVMSVEANTVSGYEPLSGTSMATPGAAGVAALMYQANPDLSPFDVRNIMQETSTYRVCHYMAANEACPEDAIPKNRQNNVYGHGQVEALPAVLEAANRVYNFTTSVEVTTISQRMEDDRIHLVPNQKITFNINGSADKIQWRTWDMRDNWMDLDSFKSGDKMFELEYDLLVDRLNFLPGNSIEGNQTLMVRAIKDSSSSANLVEHIHIMTEMSMPQNIEETPSIPFTFVILISVLVAVIRNKRA